VKRTENGVSAETVVAAVRVDTPSLLTDRRVGAFVSICTSHYSGAALMT